LFAIGNEELSGCPKIGKTILCEICSKRYRLKYGKEKLKDGSLVETMMLTLIGNKDIRRTFKNEK